MVRHMVKKNRLSGDWAVYIESSLGVLNLPWHRVTARFDTWEEAMDHADRMARTREYVLPRLGAAAIEVLSKKRFIPYRPDNAETIALSMLAYRELAEQEES